MPRVRTGWGMAMSTSTWFSSMFSSETGNGDVVSASTMNVTKIVSIFVGGFAAITQGLNSIDVVMLDSNQMLVVWLTVATLIVLLAIADMVCRSYVTAKLYTAGEAQLTAMGLPKVRVDESDGSEAHRDATLIGILPSGGTTPLAHVRLDGTKDQYVELSRVHANSN